MSGFTRKPSRVYFMLEDRAAGHIAESAAQRHPGFVVMSAACHAVKSFEPCAARAYPLEAAQGVAQDEGR